MSPKLKNVVLINIDSLRADHMGVYGYSRDTTPFLDALFKQGAVFTHATTPAYLTFQADAAILSCLYPSENNVLTWSTPINEKLPLLPGILKMYGYTTAAFVSPSLYDYFGWSKQFDAYNFNRQMKNVAQVKDEIVRWAAAAKGPFFIFWHIYDAHLPFVAPGAEFYPQSYPGPFGRPNLLFKLEKQTPTTWYYWDLTREQPYQATPHPYQLTEADVNYLKAGYDSGIRAVDDQLRLFFETMEKQPAYANTLFIISAEHGEDLKEHGYIFHRDIYEDNVHVPLAFISPLLKPEVVRSPVSTLDIISTVLPLLGIEAPRNCEGQDDRALFEGRGADGQRLIYTERPPFDEVAVRQGDWKYILRNPAKKSLDVADNGNDFFTDLMASEGNLRDELYNLAADPEEQRNLIGQNFPLESELRRAAAAFRDRMRQAREQNQAVKPVEKSLLMPYP